MISRFMPSGSIAKSFTMRSETFLDDIDDDEDVADDLIIIDLV